MLLQKPANIDCYIEVTPNTNIILQQNGFSPKYYWREHFYYNKEENILKFLKKGGYIL